MGLNPVPGVRNQIRWWLSTVLTSVKKKKTKKTRAGDSHSSNLVKGMVLMSFLDSMQIPVVIGLIWDLAGSKQDTRKGPW